MSFKMLNLKKQYVQLFLVIFSFVFVFGCAMVPDMVPTPTPDPGTGGGNGDDLRPAVIQVINNGITAVMSGDISEGFPTQISTLLSENPNLRRIEITDMPGGDALAGLAAGRLIRARNINTHVRDNGAITSAAVDFYLAGVERTLGSNVRVEVHSFSGNGISNANDLPRTHEAHTPFIEYFTSLGRTVTRSANDNSFYWFTLQASPPETVHNMTEEERTRYMITTTTQQQQAFVFPQILIPAFN